jgi:O-antigen ligase
MQYFVGFDLRGFPYQRGERLTGLFYPWPDIGYFMAILSPLLFEGIRQRSQRRRFVWLLLLPWLAVILLSGQRVALMMLALGCAGYGLHLYLIGRAVIAKRLVVPLLVVAAIGGAVASEVEVVRERLVAVEGMFSGSYEAANEASSLRLPLWEAGLQMFQAHWINGVGPRAYSEMVQRYVEPDSVWSTHRAGHPHLFVLEVAAETGLMGLVGYVLMQGVLLVLFFRVRGEARMRSGPWLLAALLASFPLASTISFYASASSSLFWVPLGMAIALQPQARFKEILIDSSADVGC